MQNKAISKYNEFGHDPTDEIQHEIETAYLDSIAASRTTFDGILSMLTDEKSDSHHASEGNEPTTMTLGLESKDQETNFCSNSFSASTPGPVSFPGSPESGLYPASPYPTVKTNLSETKAYPQQSGETIQHASHRNATDSTHASFGFESGYGPPVGNDRFKYNWADPSVTSLADLFNSLSHQELDDTPIQDHFYSPPPGYNPRKGMEEVLARMKNW